MKRIVIFASGSGTNAENIIKYFNHTGGATVVQVLSNKRDAKVLDKSNSHKISSLYFNRTAFYDSDDVLNLVMAAKPDLIVLAGFLWKFPKKILAQFPNKVINIHPALLPNYGGKGMYGMNVHQAVINNKEKASGITIHYVNEAYDEGAIIFQAKTSIETDDTAEDLAAKIHELEYEHFPKVIEKLLDKNE
ncbi:phosphoribosylglycinamide formyltransferase [Spongiivirga citrea]|uniref:Phosphoribosylglycinamide formyltransferase n=1 Tax=Spongiivirga citrea TaxID=1481457 RepID=A0A6M0CMX3_9FLAO|nr:phosphoribosylglycinamide formyltransferase [Spongiivirga citrea]NER17209.1 phosphoribosylglycinamide formyltransferase [Spongiivirga citrea]